VKPAPSKGEGRSLGWFEGHTLCDRPRPVNASATHLESNVPLALWATDELRIVNAPVPHLRDERA
jgi:hypothetical protein